jgi:multidrug resistance efflux pump
MTTTTYADDDPLSRVIRSLRIDLDRANDEVKRLEEKYQFEYRRAEDWADDRNRLARQCADLRDELDTAKAEARAAADGTEAILRSSVDRATHQAAIARVVAVLNARHEQGCTYVRMADVRAALDGPHVPEDVPGRMCRTCGKFVQPGTGAFVLNEEGFWHSGACFDNRKEG